MCTASSVLCAADFGVPCLRSTDAASSNKASYNSYEIWRAPDTHSGFRSPEADIFSYGVLIIQISTRCQLPISKVCTSV